MPRIGSFVSTLVAAAMAGACASAGAEIEELTARTHAGSLGRVPYQTLRNAVEDIVVREEGYRLARREEQYASLYYETGWKRRAPLPDEEERGVTEARTRIVIRGRRTSGELYGATFEAENQVRTRRDPAWHPARVTDDFVARMDRVLGRLRAALGGGPAASGAPRGFGGARP